MVCPTCFCTTVEDVTDLDGRARPSARASGTPASRWTSPTSTAAACASIAALALPPVDDPQAGHLDRPVRHLGLRRLRALHHLVPGGDRHHRGGRGDPGHRRRRSADRCDERSMSCWPTYRVFAGLSRRAPRADRRLRRQRAASRPASTSFREGEPADTLLPDPPRPRRARDLRARGRGADDRDARTSGELLGWSWLFPPYRWQFDARARRAGARDRVRRRLPARQVRGRPRARLRADAALRAR